MKPAPFDYIAPSALSEAISLLAKSDGEAKILAGGQSLVPLLSMRFARPELLIDLAKIDGLKYIRENGGRFEIGAMTSKREVELSAAVRSRQPVLHAATTKIGHPQIRNRGTMGGSMAQADPAAEYPAMAVALDAELVAQGPSGSRSIAASDFFITYLTTALAEDEILTEVRVPVLAAGTGWSVQEVARRHGDFAIVGAVVLLRLERGPDGSRCADTRIVLFGAGDKPLRAVEAEALVNGQAPDAELFERAGEKVGEEIDEPMADTHATAEYRRDLARVLTRRGLAEALERAESAA
ncbi:MAG: xanthine dehydrogenase family protein subunit M [Deltaproteobacteria bacterium]|nr:xanthine dehydrogenase family protein subunit M [Deltaproteobacteria bacterium]